MTLSTDTARRLAFVKGVYRLAATQSQAPEPLAAVAVLTFHDCVELFLQLCSEYLDLGAREIKFMDYWDLLDQKLGRPLTQKESMRRLNRARAGLKHQGILPSRVDIEAFRSAATNFLVENCEIVFGLSFEEISLISLVQPEAARANLLDAEKLCVEQKCSEAVEKIAIAFEELLRDYEDRKQQPVYGSPFDFGRVDESLSRSRIRLYGLEDDRTMDEMEDFVRSVTESLGAIQRALRIMALGINYPRYARFSLFLPVVCRCPDGQYIRGGSQPRLKAVPEDVSFCIEFVIESSLALQQSDYTLQHH